MLGVHNQNPSSFINIKVNREMKSQPKGNRHIFKQLSPVFEITYSLTLHKVSHSARTLGETWVHTMMN